MAIPFTCPHCGHQTLVAEQFAGQTGPCSQCGQPVTVPMGAGQAAKAPPAKSSSGSSAMLTIVISLAVGAVCLILCVGILTALLLPAVQSAREAARRASCTNNLKQIALAFHNYHDTYNTFPPAYIADDNGRPMHSWRVLILPFLNASPVYQQYDFNEPWDSPTNRPLANQFVAAYHCPSDPNTAGYTSYMVVEGPQHIFDGMHATKLSEIKDGSSNTVMLVEVRGMNVLWTEPKDLDMDMLASAGPNTPGLGGNHLRGFNVALADGAVRFIAWDQLANLAAWLTKDGAEASTVP